MTFDKLVRDPVYKQLNDALRRLIRSGEFVRGAKFLSEREIGERFAVSRATANKALSTLVAEGVLRFKKGVGTFVHASAQGAGRDLGFDERVRLAGFEPLTEVLRAELLDAKQAAELAERLESDSVYFIERLRSAGGKPLILERRWIVARVCPGLLEHDLRASLRSLWSAHYNLELGEVSQSLRAIAASESEAALLNVTPGAACLAAMRLTRLASGKALCWETSLHRGDVCEISSLTPDWSILPAALQRAGVPAGPKGLSGISTCSFPRSA
jgi:GntR family transcriptional regulator